MKKMSEESKNSELLIEEIANNINVPKEELQNFIKQLTPKGFKNNIASTWQSGWQGKACVMMGGVGAGVTFAAIIEGIGAITGVDSIRVLKKLAEWYA
jgi:hypothetical protein